MDPREMLERMARVAEATEDHTMWKIQAALRELILIHSWRDGLCSDEVGEAVFAITELEL